jgi:hypothetical protein
MCALPWRTGRDSGSACWQMSAACGQRGWNRHPDGRSTGLGGSPRTLTRAAAEAFRP